MKLNKTAIRDASCKAGARFTDHSCTSPEGVVLRVWAPSGRSPEGRKSVLVRFRVNGKYQGITLGAADARPLKAFVDEARVVRLAAAHGVDPWEALDRHRGVVDPGPAPAMADSFRAVAERYMTEHGDVHCTSQTQALHRQLIDNYLAPLLGDIPVDQVSRTDISGMHRAVGTGEGKPLGDEGSRISEKGSPALANRCLTLASAICSHAERWGLRPRGTNPTEDVKRFRDRKRSRVLTPEEEETLFEVLDNAERLGPRKKGGLSRVTVELFRFLAYTGMRRGEAVGMKWAYVDFSLRCVVLPESKEGGEKTVILPDAAIEVLRRVKPTRAYGTAYCFPGVPSDAGTGRGAKKTGQPLRNITRSWAVIRKAAGLDGSDGKPPFRVHDLRHTFITKGIVAGVGLKKMGDAVGHRSPTTTQRYATLADEVLRDAVSRASAARLPSRRKR